MAKRMILVEERLYDDMWKRTPIENSKSHLSNKLQAQLNSSNVGDDEKAKQYQITLRHFLNLKQRIPEQELAILNGVKEEKVVRASKKRMPSWIPLAPARTSKRRHIKWSRYDE